MSALELSDIVGQDAAIARLRMGMSGGRLPHALLLAGPAGVGRRTTAIALARTLLCGNSTDQACGECDDCRMMDADSHPDFQLVYKELARYHDDASVRSRVMQDLGIHVIRSFLISPAGRSATRGKGKIFVVLEAELMSIPAQNALLKTLEEPPPGVTIILITQRPEQLLPTTLSRCCLIRFANLPAGFVTSHLIACEMEPAEAAFWAAFSEGSIGRSTKLAAQGMYELKCDVIRRLGELTPLGDVELGEHLTKLTDGLAAKAVTAAKKLDGANLSKQLASRRAAGAMMELIASAFRDAMAVASGCDRPLIHSDQAADIQAIAGRFEPPQLARIVESLSRCEQLLWRNVNPKTVWDNVVIACATAAPLGV